jgi:hypothetical protein
MWLRYLPANQAWAFLFGETVATATVVSVGGVRLFPHRSDAVDAARSVGLTVATDGQVS